MAKHVVLDAIARSGTTLMSALLRSQEKTMAFCPGFNDSLSCYDIGEWPHGACQQDFVANSNINFEKFKEDSFSQIVDYSQYYGLTKEEWKSIIFDANDPDQLRRTELLGSQILSLCVEVGGTITGEHGVGVEKLNEMCLQFDPLSLAQMHEVRNAFDPLNLLNPGKALPTLNRCAEFGAMKVSGGKLPHSHLERF